LLILSLDEPKRFMKVVRILSKIIGQTPSEARRQVRVTCYFGN